MRIRLVIAAVPVAVLAIASGSLAAGPKATPQIVDPKGDSAAGQAALDIVSVQYSTTGTGAGKAYKPNKLVVTLTLAGPPSRSGAVSYNVVADTDGCGLIDIRYTPGDVADLVSDDTYTRFGSCAESTWFFAKVKGSVVTFEYSLKAIKIDRGTMISDFTASVDLKPPVFGDGGTDGGPADGPGDKATGDGTWIVP